MFRFGIDLVHGHDIGPRFESKLFMFFAKRALFVKEHVKKMFTS